MSTDMSTENHADLTPEQVGRELGLHVETVYRLLRAGHLPGFKAGLRRWLTPRAELDAYKQAGLARRPGRPYSWETRKG